MQVNRHLLAWLCVVSLAVTAPSAFSQDQSAPDANARVHFGPLALNPTIGLTNVGVDNNVFYEPDVQNPKSDFTMTLTPGTDLWLRFGRAWLTANLKEDLVYYKEYASQRSANNFDTVGLTLPFNRLTLKAKGTYTNTNDRPGYEIAARIHHVDTGYDGSVELRVLSKTFVSAHAGQTTFNYDANAVYFGTNLNQELNHQSTIAGVTIRHQLTPLTAVTLDGSTQRDRFDIDPYRDADSNQFTAGVQFDPFALIKGSATFGYRDFKPIDPTIPTFTGFTMGVNLSYVLLGTTKLGIGATRDVQFSYQITQPYYVQTGVNGSIAQQIYGPFDVVVRAGVARLAYQDQVGAVLAYPNEVDHIRTFGGGAGYHLGRDMRIGFDVSEQRRTSPNPLWTYHGLVAGMSVTYGY